MYKALLSKHIIIILFFCSYKPWFWFLGTKVWNQRQLKIYYWENVLFLAKSAPNSVKCSVIRSQWCHQIYQIVIILTYVGILDHTVLELYFWLSLDSLIHIDKHYRQNFYEICVDAHVTISFMLIFRQQQNKSICI